MMTSYLCKCLNCDSILVDENPQIGAIEYEIMGSELNMEWVQENEFKEGFWACPVCHTDGYFIDL